MIGKFLETFFRHKLLILLPVMLVPLIATPAGFFILRPYYESDTVVWVARMTYLRSGDDVNSWLTPAQIESARMSELLRTRAFMTDVARRTDLAPSVGNPQGEAQLAGYFARFVTVIPNGNNLVTVTARAEQPELSSQVANAIVETYRERRMSERAEQANIAVSFHEERLREAQEVMGKATSDIRRYVAANPRLTTIDPSRGAASTAAARMGLPPVAIDPQLAEFIRRVDAEQREVDNIRIALNQARMETSAGMEGQDVNFRVIDPAQVPIDPVSQRRRLTIFPAAGIVVGAGLALGLLVALVAADRSIRTTNDLPAGVRVARVVPLFAVSKLPKRSRPSTTRQAIGFVAGSALPIPRGVK